MSSKIVIAAYDPAWPAIFEEIRDRVAECLGSLAVTIEHIGSTSVTGLAAKPIIDMCVVVKRVADVPEGIRLLATLGYEHEGDLGIKGREAFSIPPGTPDHHLYLAASDARELKRHLAFRDRLRRDAGALKEYESLKRRLAATPGIDHTNYSLKKTRFVEAILAEELGVDH